MFVKLAYLCVCVFPHRCHLCANLYFFKQSSLFYASPNILVHRRIIAFYQSKLFLVKLFIFCMHSQNTHICDHKSHVTSWASQKFISRFFSDICEIDCLRYISKNKAVLHTPYKKCIIYNPFFIKKIFFIKAKFLYDCKLR